MSCALAALIPAVVLLAGSAAASAAEPSARMHAFATLPDWTGIWETEAAVSTDHGVFPPTPQLWDKPPYTAAAQKNYAPTGYPLAGARDVFAVLFQLQAGITPQGDKACQPFGFPTVMEMPVGDVLIELIVTPEQTLLLGSEGTVRHIYTDGRAHPQAEDLWPTPTGDSIGHWEADTLVIDTIAREPGAVGPAQGTANLSEQARFSERLHRVDANTFQDDMTIEDPLRFTQPWRVRIRYARVTNVSRLIPVDCEHDRNTVGKQLGIAPP